MGERQTEKENIGRGELLFLTYPGNENVFSGYGLTVQPDNKHLLVGILIVDRPAPADYLWLKNVERVFGEYRLVTMTTAGDRGIICRMQIQQDSISYLSQSSSAKTVALTTALEPLLEQLPKPSFILHWGDEKQLWVSRITPLFNETRDVR